MPETKTTDRGNGHPRRPRRPTREIEIVPARFPDETFWETLRPVTPPVDVLETRERVIVRVELPGHQLDDVDVQLSEDAVTITSRAPSEGNPDALFHRAERSHGLYRRRIALPAAVDGDRARATLAHGVLELVLPKHTD